ncbi:Chorion peroxidase [Fragariocoptes setiger]|uniref:Chorion peroxidase n=1 Tax=Fragariocoptes setiger TaxID=1670756 RepID=A0ABQ7S9T2_9ACAR|nr:Chorion peroxidase [Fragariocoptes setiger]
MCTRLIKIIQESQNMIEMIHTDSNGLHRFIRLSFSMLLPNLEFINCIREKSQQTNETLFLDEESHLQALQNIDLERNTRDMIQHDSQKQYHDNLSHLTIKPVIKNSEELQANLSRQVTRADLMKKPQIIEQLNSDKLELNKAQKDLKNLISRNMKVQDEPVLGRIINSTNTQVLKHIISPQLLEDNNIINIKVDQQVNNGSAIVRPPSTSDSQHAVEFSLDDPQQAQSSLMTASSIKSESCAVVLKRTYLLKAPHSKQNDEWGDKYVFNEIDDVERNKKQKYQKKTHVDVCIRHADVERAIGEAKHQLRLDTPDDVDTLDISEQSVGQLGELNLLTSQLLVKKFALSHDEIMYALPMIDMSSTQFYRDDLCPKIVMTMHCSRTRYRTHTAHCNNLKHPAWGATKTPFARYLPPDYADGLQEPRRAQSGQPLPSARLITSIVHRDVDVPSNDFSMLFSSWGQLLDHDMSRAAPGSAPECCPHYLRGLCMPIPVPKFDPFYSKFGVKCLKFDRSLAAIRPKCKLGVRLQINTLTSPIDANFVYGSTKTMADQLREFDDGQMRVWNYFKDLKPLLPPKDEQPDDDCLARPKGLFCFMAGDVRVNEQTHLTVLHTLYVREHNRMAKILAELNIDWDDDRIYHEVRHIQAAGVQHVLMNEFLPLLLGPKLIDSYNLKPQKHGGYWNGYDPSVTTSTGTGFAAAAFRYGHSSVQGMIRRFSKHHKFIKGTLLRHLFKRPFLLYQPGVMDQLIGGLINTPMQTVDPFMSEEVSGHLFQPPDTEFGHDLAAINIQRGRDQGLPGYVEWREWCGLSRVTSFEDLEPILSNKTAHHYSRIYKSVDDIDLWSAGVSEKRMHGMPIGPTFACIIARQFFNTKRGDRFWYELPDQPSSFTPEQLREIKKITLAKLLCVNADDLPTIQPWALRLPHPIYNARVRCDSLPTIDLKHWDYSKLAK